MPFPVSERVVYRQNPLVEVICQLRFPPILEISASEPAEFQKLVRGAYPLYSKDSPFSGLPKDVSELVTRFGLPDLGQPITHKFLTEDSARFISLNRDFLAVTNTRYQRWENFRQQIQMAQQALETVYAPSFYNRVGLRYRNIIDRMALRLDWEPWSSLVRPALAGVLGAEDVRDNVRSTLTEALINVSDVEGGAVKLQYGLIRLAPSEADRLMYVIDADFYTEKRSGPYDVSEALDRFNRHAGNLFRWAISPRLEEALQPLYPS